MSRRLLSRPAAHPRWRSYSPEHLLQVRFCDLDLSLEGSWIEPLVDRLGDELADRGVRVRPHVWASTEWASPDGIPGIQVPFYLLHPKLAALERAQMGEVEGGNRHAAMRLLRHEMGHVLQHAYELQRRPRWRRAFGTSVPYPTHYRPNPTSRSYVQHLGHWYAQSHPAEDFAETFAVWLRPRSRWRRDYAGWPALRKLEYVDQLADVLRDQAPRVRTRARPETLRSLRMTLGEYYEDKRSHYGAGYPSCYDEDLFEVFTRHTGAHGMGAAQFIRRNRRETRSVVCRWTGINEFCVDQVIDDMTGRCRELGLRALGSQRRVAQQFTLVLAINTVKTLRRRAWLPL